MSAQATAQLQTMVKPAVTPVVSGLLQRCTATTECAECRKKREGTLQRAAVNNSPNHEVPPIVHEVLRSPGQPLDVQTRAFMEPRFGHDFSGVRVHTDAKAAKSARAVNALAYTVGQDVVFGIGKYAPGTTEGRWLLAHELAHTVQQASFSVLSPRNNKLTVGEPNGHLENEADMAADRVIISRHISAHNDPLALTFTTPVLARVDCSTVPQNLCKGIYSCGHGGSGKCYWGGTYPDKRCMCFGSTQRSAQEAESWIQANLPAWILALLSAAALALLIACFATGVCEAAALIGAVGAAAAALIIILLRGAGVDVNGASGEAPIA